MKRIFAALCTLALTGCATPAGTGSRWYAPATWFSHAPAAHADRADARVADAKEKAIGQAHRSVLTASVALQAAPPSRPVEVAVNATDSALALLDQAEGPLTPRDVAGVKAMVAGLLSENAELRAKAERLAATERETVDAIGDRLKAAETASAASRDRLRLAYDRENALANQLRAQRALAWIAGAVALLATAGWLYVKLFFGSIPTAIGSALSSIQRTSPAMADTLRTHLDAALNRGEQALIKSAFNKMTP